MSVRSGDRRIKAGSLVKADPKWLALVLVFSVAPVWSFALDSASQYWLVILMTMVLLVLMALVAHLVVEKPGVSLGNSLVGALRLPAARETYKAAVESTARLAPMPGSFTTQSAQSADRS